MRSKGGFFVDLNKVISVDKSYLFIMLIIKFLVESCCIFFEWKCILNRKVIFRGSVIYI